MQDRFQEQSSERRGAIMSVTEAPITGPALKAMDARPDGNSLRRFLRVLWTTMFNEPYRPERHYMRGPGPACARKHSLVP
jgi:hypothetical protein